MLYEELKIAQIKLAGDSKKEKVKKIQELQEQKKSIEIEQKDFKLIKDEDVVLLKNNVEYFSILNNEFNLNIDYFQTTIMLYHTDIIEDDTYNNILNLLKQEVLNNSISSEIIFIVKDSIKTGINILDDYLLYFGKDVRYILLNPNNVFLYKAYKF